MKPTYVPKTPPPDHINSSDLKGNKTLIYGMLMFILLIGGLLVISKVIPGILVSITPAAVENTIGKALSKHPFIKGGTSSEKLDEILSKLINPKELNIHSISELPKGNENAFATIDRRILVTSSLIDNSKSEIALAFVIAHEIGHIKHRHPLKSLYQNFLIQFLLSLIGAGNSATDLSGQLASSSFSRSQESEADLFGLNLVHQSYGSIEGAFDFFTRMKKYDKMVSLTSGSLLSTHPLSEKRIETLIKYAQEKGWDPKLN